MTPGPDLSKRFHSSNSDSFQPEKDWNTIRLTDAEIVDFVNLRFISEYHSYSPEEVIRMRSAGAGFITINDNIKKAGKKGKGASHKGGAKGKGKGK